MANMIYKTFRVDVKAVNEETGEVMESLGSTTTMSTFEFETYLTNVRVWAAEYLNCVLPFPNE